MNPELITKLKMLKKKYASEGFIILGIFGSYARDEQTPGSDIDILYELSEDIYERFPGWEIFPVLERIEQEIENELQSKVDIANKNALNEIGEKYILPEVIYI